MNGVQQFAESATLRFIAASALREQNRIIDSANAATKRQQPFIYFLRRATSVGEMEGGI